MRFEPYDRVTSGAQTHTSPIQHEQSDDGGGHDRAVRPGLNARYQNARRSGSAMSEDYMIATVSRRGP